MGKLQQRLVAAGYRGSEALPVFIGFAPRLRAARIRPDVDAADRAGRTS